MRCGKTEQLIDWLIEEVERKPDGDYVVATSTVSEADAIWDRLVPELLNKRLVKKVSRTEVRTLAGGRIRRLSSRANYASAQICGCRIDEAFVSDGVTPDVLAAIEPAVQPRD